MLASRYNKFYSPFLTIVNAMQKEFFKSDHSTSTSIFS